MSDEATSATTPDVSAASASPPAASNLATPAIPDPPPDASAWLPARLEQAERAALKKAGFASIEEARAAQAELQAKRDAAKTIEQKAADAEAALKAERDRNAQLSAALSDHAARLMSGLTAEQAAAIRSVAGDDPALQVKAIGAISATWGKQVAAPAEPPPANPATTAPAAPAPAAASPGSPPDKRAIYSAAAAKNPFLAARFGVQNSEEVFGSS